jgi:hypothetical protein
MATILNNTKEQIARDNDYFTSTIVGMPAELSLGKAFTARKLTASPAIVIDAISAKTWLSEPAQQLLAQRVKQSPKTMGLPFAAGSFAHTRTRFSDALPFLLGFALCAVLSVAYSTFPWF